MRKNIFLLITVVMTLCLSGCNSNTSANKVEPDVNENDTEEVWDYIASDEEDSYESSISTNEVYYKDEAGQWQENEKALKFKLKIYAPYFDTTDLKSHDKKDQLLEELQGTYYASSISDSITISGDEFVGKGPFLDVAFDIKHIYDAEDTQSYIDEYQTALNDNFSDVEMFLDDSYDSDLVSQYGYYKTSMFTKKVYNKHYILFGQVKDTEDYECINLFVGDDGLFEYGDDIFSRNLDPNLEQINVVSQCLDNNILSGSEVLEYTAHLMKIGYAAIIKTDAMNDAINYGCVIKFDQVDPYIVSNDNYTVDGFNTINDTDGILGSLCNNEVIIPLNNVAWSYDDYNMYTCWSYITNNKQRNYNLDNLFDTKSMAYISKDSKFIARQVAVNEGLSHTVIGVYFDQIDDSYTLEDLPE